MISYEFLADLKRLSKANRRFQRLVFALNISIVSLALYTALQLIGLTSFFKFYGTLAESIPIIISIAIGVGVATVIMRRQRVQIFDLLGPELSEMARAAYDNRGVHTPIMERLAAEVKVRLSAIPTSKIMDLSKLYLKIGIVAVLCVTVPILAHYHVAVVDVTPADKDVINEITRKVSDLFQNDSLSNGGGRNISMGIYGKPSLAVLQESKMEIELYPGSGVGSRAVNTSAVDRLFELSPPGQGVAVPSEVYIESLPPLQRDIIKRYFQNLAGG